MATNGTSSSSHTQVYPAADSPIGNIASLADKVALITGASTGLGRAIALAYAAAGAYVVSGDLSPTPVAAPIVEASQKGDDHTTPTIDLINAKWPAAKGGRGNGQRAAYIKCDVTDEQSVKDAVAFTVQTFGRLDIMVNNAGISAEASAQSYDGTFTRIHETPVSILDKTLAVNVRGVWLGTKHAAAQFLAQEPRDPSLQDRGWIINLASILASAGLVGASSYCASKGAVLQITRAAALEYARDGIHVNAIQPGFSDTHLLETMYEKVGTENMHKSLNVAHPWGRTGKPVDIARVAVFLAGDGAGWVTGSSVVVDGGYLAQ